MINLVGEELLAHFVVSLQQYLRVLVDWWAQLLETILLLEVLDLLHSLIAFLE